MNPELLRSLSLLADVPDAELERLGCVTSEVEVARGEVLMEEGSEPDAVYVVLEGAFDVSKRSGGQDVDINRAEAGEVLGELAVLAGRPRSATVRACSDGRVLKIEGDGLHELLTSPTAAEPILRTVVSRLENQEVQLRQHSKMAALGTLTAGLLHELNNPAAAVGRGVARLEGILGAWRAATASLAGSGADLDALSTARPSGRASADPLARSDITARLEDWLEGRGVDEPWEVSSGLAEQGWDPGELATVLEGMPTGEAARWLALSAELEGLLGELREGSRRISEIVGSVKGHSRSDEAPVQNVDVHELLESTFVIMRHKLREGITVVRELQPGPLLVECYPSELNQVWTNLVDNAADAMGGSGELVVRTAATDDAAVVSFTDDGPGIPPEVEDRIFEPFFTTKPVGEGSGVGLASVFRIVTQRHRGRIEVESEPGRTTFTVRLPKRLAL